MYIYVVDGASDGKENKNTSSAARNQNRGAWKRPNIEFLSMVCCVLCMVDAAYATASLTDTAITRRDGRARGYVFCCLFAFNLTFI